jgi:hypothetical protein
MSTIPKKLRDRLSQSLFHKHCARKGIMGHECAGRITWDHAVIFAGSQVQEEWAIVPLCAKGHSVDQWQDSGDHDKAVSLWIALNRASAADLEKYSRANFQTKLAYLNGKYGTYRAFIDNEIAY